MLSVYKKFKPYLLGVIIGLSICCIGLFFYLNYSFTPHDIWNDLTSGEIVKKLPKPYVVYSGSMEPAIKTASVIFTLPQSTYVMGDVITFALNDDNDNLVTHRIEHKEYPYGIYKEPIYLTSGDANEDFDKWKVTDAQITGKVFFSVPYLGYIVDFAKTPHGFILFVVIPATIIIYEELKFLANKFRKLTSKLKQKLTQPLRDNHCKVTPLESKKSKNGVPKISVLIPTVGALVVLIAVSAGFFSDNEASSDNTFTAAVSFPVTVVLENKKVYSDWAIVEDNIRAELAYHPVWPTFDYDFSATGLNQNIEYCLIYYADPWPGDGLTHSTGFRIDSGQPDVDGNLNIIGSKDIGTDLPNPDDENYPDGGKVWLIPCSNYDEVLHKVSPWDPNEIDWLFDADETHFVNYARTFSTPTPTPTSFVSPTPTPSPPPSTETQVVNFSNLNADPQFGSIHDYVNASVSFTYNTPAVEKLGGTLNAEGLKPHATYQVKFEAIPTCLDPINGNDDLNEIIGYKGRWFNNSTNSNLNSSPANNDAYYQANSIYHGGTECIAGYLVWDYLTADSSGDATKFVQTENSYHVLWCDGFCDMTGNSLLQNLDGAINPPGFPHCNSVDVNGELERFGCNGLILDPGHYKLKMILLEESFHQSSFGTWTTVMDTDIEFDIFENHPVINEFLANPDDPNDASEWIELYNPTSDLISLDGWILDDIEGGTQPFSLNGKSIAPYQFLVVEKSESGIGLNNSGDTIRLLNSSTLIDTHTYTSNPGTNVSIGRDPDATAGFNICALATKGSSNTGNCP